MSRKSGRQSKRSRSGRNRAAARSKRRRKQRTKGKGSGVEGEEADPSREARRQRRRASRTSAADDSAGSAERKTRRRKTREASDLDNQAAPTRRSRTGSVMRSRSASTAGSADSRFRTSVMRASREDRLRDDEIEELKAGLKARPELDSKEYTYSGKSETGGRGAAVTTALVVGALLCALGGGLMVVMMKDEPRKAPKLTRRARPEPGPKRGGAKSAPGPKDPGTGPAGAPERPGETPRRAPEVEVADAENVQSGQFVSDELINKSEMHKALADMLTEFDAILNEQRTGSNRFEDFRERRRREDELLQRIRDLGDEAVPALVDMIRTLGGHGFQLFLARALAGMESPVALKATEELLIGFKNHNVRVQIIRELPQTPEAAAVVGRALPKIENANVRVRLLQEYAMRTRGQEGEEIAGVFREIALNDDFPQARAEAITILGRRGRPEERDILERIVRDDKHPTVRQRAILSLAKTAGESSLPALQDVLRREDSSENIRASAVLALTLIQGPALPVLEDLARNDPSEIIRRRAQSAIESIRIAMQNQRARGGKVATPPSPPFSNPR